MWETVDAGRPDFQLTTPQAVRDPTDRTNDEGGLSPSSSAIESGVAVVGSPSTQHQQQNGNKKRRITTNTFTRRKRAVIACQFCRLRKTKCDTVRPACGFCRYHKATCIYDDNDDDREGGRGSEQSQLPLNRGRKSDPGTTPLGDRILSSLGEIKQLLQQQQQPQWIAQDGNRSPQRMAQTALGPSRHEVGRDSSWTSSSSTRPGGLSQNSMSRQTTLPAARCESMLRWPIFRGIINEPDAQIESFLFEAEGNSQPTSPAKAMVSEVIRDDAFVPLCRRFLEHVHPRNPILQKEELMSYALDVTANGLRWDAASCLVLLACGLACHAMPWHPAIDTSNEDFIATPTESRSGIADGNNNAALAEAYFQAAKKRIGLLESSIIDIQCLFFASVFERYALRPTSAWAYIQQGCTLLQIYLRRKGRQKSHSGVQLNAPTDYLEQRIFWTCYKAESELTIDLGFQPSCLGDLAYPDLFPTPPEAVTSASQPNNYGAREDTATDGEDIEVERRSWLFYLAEISLRRTIDDTLWLFYHQNESYWIQNEDLILHQYIDFNKQIHLWYSHLPSSISFAPPENSDNEFAMFLHSRFLDWQETALRPLVFIFLHRPAAASSSQQEHRHQEFAGYIRDAITVASEAIHVGTRHHRHGGTWLVARKVFSSALLILAVAIKQGHLDALPDWPSPIDKAMTTLRKWGREAHDLMLMADVLQRMLDSTRQHLGSEPRY